MKQIGIIMLLNMAFIIFLITRNYKQKQKGCLAGKTPQQKKAFFESLASFVGKDDDFFIEQCNDLLPHEKQEFLEYVQQKNENLKAIKILVDVLNELAPNNQQPTTNN